LTVGTTPAIVTSKGWVVRAADGKVLAKLEADMDMSGGCWIPCDDEQDIVIFAHGYQTGGNNTKDAGMRAFKLKSDGQNGLKAEELWTLERQGWMNGAPVVHRGRLYTAKGSYDILTGKADTAGVSKGAYQSLVLTANAIWALNGDLGPDKPKPSSKPGLAILPDGKVKSGPAVPLILEPDEYTETKFFSQAVQGKGGFGIFTENPEAPVRTWARAALKEGVIGWLNAPPNDNGWMNNFYGSPPFLAGDRVYCRSRAFLYCLGPKP
jgi:hypothetical protein